MGTFSSDDDDNAVSAPPRRAPPRAPPRAHHTRAVPDPPAPPRGFTPGPSPHLPPPWNTSGKTPRPPQWFPRATVPAVKAALLPEPSHRHPHVSRRATLHGNGLLLRGLRGPRYPWRRKVLVPNRPRRSVLRG